MKQKEDTIYNKITLLNKTILSSMTRKDKNAIIKNFTDMGIRILGADFGFAWWKLSDKDEYRLAYKNPSTPYEPALPRAKLSNYKALKSKKPFFDSNVKKENYESSNITPYMKSFIVIPIFHNHYTYGNLILCYKKRHDFTKEDLMLAQAIGHTTAQAITIHRLIQTDALLKEEKSKTEFIANATHELRTPLAIMRGNVDLALIDKGNLKSAQQALSKVSAEINILSDHIEDLSLMTYPSRNIKQIINPVPVNIRSLMNKLVKRMRAVALEKNIQITIKKGTGNLLIIGDEEYLTKLFLNLIKNSITYGKNNGNIFIDLSLERKMVKITIADDGIGISNDDLPRIFDRFYRGDKAHTHHSYGNHSGLGLAIVKWVAEVHGGEVSVTSVRDKGSIFSVSLPVKTPNNVILS